MQRSEMMSRNFLLVQPFRPRPRALPRLCDKDQFRAFFDTFVQAVFIPSVIPQARRAGTTSAGCRKAPVLIEFASQRPEGPTHQFLICRNVVLAFQAFGPLYFLPVVALSSKPRGRHIPAGGVSHRFSGNHRYLSPEGDTT